MRRVVGRVLVTLAIALPVPVLLVSAAHGAAFSTSGPAVLKCMHWKGDLNLSPGISDSPGNQSVQAHGKLFGCNKGGGGAQFQGSFQMSGATCANVALSGSATFDWANGTHSTAFLVLHPQALEPNKVLVNGSLTSGNFDGLTVTSWLRFTQVFGGSGAPCTSANPLKKIQFTNSQSFQLQTPQTSATTQPSPPPIPPPTQGPPRHGPPQTVPVTNHGTLAQRSPPPVTVIIQQCCINVPGTVFVRQTFPTGTLAFTGSSGLAALFGLEALLIGGALACVDRNRKERRALRLQLRRGPKEWLRVTLPPSRM